LGTLATALPGVFAGGDLVRRRRLAVRSIADGKIAADGISRYLEGQAPRAASHACASRAGRLERGELECLISGEVSREDRQAPATGGPGGFDPGEARLEALRCLHCDCRKKDDCGLRDFSEGYGAEQGRFRGTRRVLVPLNEGSQLIFEAGKCIACGLCVQIAQEGGETLGLAFLGRGFNLRVGVPFDRPLGEGLTHTAQACLEACPTGALALASRLPEPQPWEKR
jgi:ferredoxin